MTRLAALVAAGALGGAILVLAAGGNVHGYCHSRGSLPDALCTPGSRVTHDRAIVCAAGYRPAGVSTGARHIVLREYGIPSRESARYRLVALIPLRLGGSGRIANLWPLALTRRPGPVEKQRLDQTLRSLACGGRLTVFVAQHAAARDWVSAYRRRVPGAATSRQ